MNEAYRDISELLLSLDPQVQLEIANSIWVHERFDILPSFRDRVTTYYDAEATELDFSDPAATDAINAWASDHTQGRIQEVLKSIDPEEVMFLINSIYFNGSWRSEFDPRDTRPQPFHLEDGSEAMVPLMSQEDVAGRPR